MSDITPGCSDVEALAPEIALGIVSGSERGEAVAHLAHCPTCRRLVEDLTAVADPLLLIAPEMEPSIGFESRVLAPVTGAANPNPNPSGNAAPAAPTPPPPSVTAHRPRRRRFSLPATGIAAATVLVAAALGLLAGRAIDTSPPAVRTATAVAANGKATCRAFAYGDQQAWVFVSLEAPREWTAEYTVEITTEAGGTPAAVGHFRLQDGTGALGTTVDVPASHLKAIRVLDASGALRYEATFSEA